MGVCISTVHEQIKVDDARWGEGRYQGVQETGDPDERYEVRMCPNAGCYSSLLRRLPPAVK